MNSTDRWTSLLTRVGVDQQLTLYYAEPVAQPQVAGEILHNDDGWVVHFIGHDSATLPDIPATVLYLQDHASFFEGDRSSRPRDERTDEQKKCALAKELLANWADGLLGDESCLNALASAFLDGK